MESMLTKNYPRVSRREFLTTAMGAGGAALLGPSWLGAAAADEADPRVAQVLSKTISVDMHNHVYPAGTEPHPQGGPPRQQEQPTGGPALSVGEELKHSGLTAVCASFVLDFAPGDPHQTYLHWLSAVDAQLETGHIRRALNLKDLQAAHDHGRPTIVQTVEGAMFIEGHLDRVEEVYKRGLRDLQLLHEHDDKVSPLGDTNTGAAHLGGLTAFGAEVVKECNRLGILIDLAHASGETVKAALKVTTQPFIVSHTSLNSRTGSNPRMAQMMGPRLISKEQAKVVADAGGVVGVWTHMADSLKDFVESIKAMADVVGIEHCGIGTDSDLLSARVGQGTNRVWPNMTGGFFPVVVGEMLRQGFAPDEISKIAGGNFCRVFGKATAGHV